MVAGVAVSELNDHDDESESDREHESELSEA
jgi:hypothetical protein